MRIRGTIAAAWLCAGLSVLFGQDPAGQDQQPVQPQGGLHTGTTPIEQRDRDIGKFDPLEKSDTTAGVDQQRPDQGTVPATPAVSPPPQSPRPLPGSVAASSQPDVLNPRGQGPHVLPEDGEAGQGQDYSGPAVLSRSYTLARPSIPQTIKWTPSFGFSSVYQTGLTSGAVNPDGTLSSGNSAGATATWALVGRHLWKHDVLGLDYSGSYNRFGSASGYSGTNQALNVDFAHRFSKHLRFDLIESGTIYSQNFALLNQAASPDGSVANVNLAANPTVQVVDRGTTRQFTTMADVTWQKSARLSFSYGGGFFAVQRTGVSLIGNVGYQARADVNYRYTRKITVGVYYSFDDYTFDQHILISNDHTMGGIFSYALNRGMQIRLRGGLTRSESEGLTSVTIDPVIAALIGHGTTAVDSYHLSYISDGSAELVKDFGRNKSANISYARGLTPGNGLILASAQESITAGFTARLFHIYNASFGAGRTTLSSISQTAGTYSTQYANFTISRHVSRTITANVQVDYRKFTLSNQAGLQNQASVQGMATAQIQSVPQNQFRISTGFSWSPPEGRLR
jgi:hypothetical protein